jgi:hypothetical protein
MTHDASSWSVSSSVLACFLLEGGVGVLIHGSVPELLVVAVPLLVTRRVGVATAAPATGGAAGSAVPAGAELPLVGACPHGVRLAAVAVPAGVHVVVVAAVLVQPRVAHPEVPLLLLLLPAAVEGRVVPRRAAPAAAVFRVRPDALEVSSGASPLFLGSARHVGGRPTPAAVFGERRPDALAAGRRRRRRRQLLGVAVHATAEVVRRVLLLGAAVEPVPAAAAAGGRGARERRRGNGVPAGGLLVGLSGGFGTRGLAEEEAATAPRVRRARRRDGHQGGEKEEVASTSRGTHRVRNRRWCVFLASHGPALRVLPCTPTHL